MIIDLKRFIAEERPYWSELDSMLNAVEAAPEDRLDIGRVKRLHYLYQRASAGLARLMHAPSEAELRPYLEALVARAYGEIHETREKPHRLNPRRWFFVQFPRAFRRHIWAFWVAVAITFVSAIFGALAITLDDEARDALLPFGHAEVNPAERVAHEEQVTRDRLKGHKAQFSAFLMTHNTRVSVFTMALGMTWGVGTAIMLLANGAILGAITVDYVHAGQTRFLLGWLLPHGSVEIPSILIAGQAGLLLGAALIGWGSRVTLRERLRAISADLVTLVFGVATLLVWAGIVEAFFSQYHEPIIPYSLKISIGATELVLLTLFLSKSGSKGIEGNPE